MVTPRQYATAGALRTALETRLLERSRRDAVDLHRLRRQVAFDRLLARMFDANLPGRDGWVLKGGYALEMRFHRARATKDLDLTVRVTSIGQTPPDDFAAALRERLQLAASVELADFFVFNVGEASLELNQAPEGGSRFPIDARLDGRSFVKFHVDLGVGDEVIEPVDRIVGDDWLAFAGIPTIPVPTLSAEQHWAEKLHAYTLPRDGATNSRVKDLVDLVLLIELQAMSPTRIHVAVATTFARRGTHAVPIDLPPPPSAWEKPFTALAAECRMAHTLTSAYENVAAYWRSLTERSEAR
jgi:Nucleotidyl transferase AbiEii toxin, Type IV TA system